MINNEIYINGNLIKNRVVIQPMEGCDGTPDGAIGELTRRRYLRFAKSGAGIIWFEAVAVTNEGRANPRQLFINEANKDSFKVLLAEIRQTALDEWGFAPKIIAQLTHSGRQSRFSSVPTPIVAYRNEFLETGKEHLEYTVATDEYCDTLPEKFSAAAKLCVEAGFDGIDVKCCHAYLISEFLGATERQGKYGGSFENRVSLFMSCLDAVKSVVPENFILTSRLNASDCYPYPNGYGVDENNEIDLTECVKILGLLKNRGVEMVNITLGNPYRIPHINRPWRTDIESVETGMSRFRKVMSQLKKQTDLKLVYSALTPLAENAIEGAQSLMNQGFCDFAGFGRMAFAYPDFYADYLKNGGVDKKKCCLLCGKCTELMRAGTVSGCPVRDSEKYFPYYKKYVLKKEG